VIIVLDLAPRNVDRMRFHVLAAPDCCLSPSAKSGKRIITMIATDFRQVTNIPLPLWLDLSRVRR